MIYAKIENGVVSQYPLTQTDIRNAFPNVSFPVSFSPPDGYVEVVLTPEPLVEYTQNVNQSAPIIIDGIWRQNWEITSASQEEIDKRIALKWQGVRIERNIRLAASDWTQLPDAPVDSAAWAIYRQALRDVTTQADPFAITWPVQPE